MSKNNINRLVILVIVLCLGFSYLYYKTLIYYEIVSCYSYNLNVYKARPTIYTIKYFYKYGDKYYFDQARYTSPKKAILSSKAQVRVCKLNPSKNYLISKRSNTSSNYGFKIQEPFIDTIDININSLKDYYPTKFNKIILDNKKPLIYPKDLDDIDHKKIIEAINKVVFCEGSLIETFILTKELDGYILNLVHYYLNDFSVDSKLTSIYHKLLKEALNKDIEVIIIDKNKEKEKRTYFPTNKSHL